MPRESDFWESFDPLTAPWKHILSDIWDDLGPGSRKQSAVDAMQEIETKACSANPEDPFTHEPWDRVDSILNDNIMAHIPQKDLALAELTLKKREKKALLKKENDTPRFSNLIPKPKKFDTKIVIVTESWDWAEQIKSWKNK